MTLDFGTVELDPTPKPRHLRAVPKAAPRQKKTHPYYDFGYALSHNATYNFIVGGRGLGKTYGAKKLAIKNYLKSRREHGADNADMFIYLRRFIEEMKGRNSFFMDIAHEFPDWDFEVDGQEFKLAPANTRDDKKRPWEVFGYFLPLSTAQKLKSIPYPRVKLIIFDEFIIEKGVVHYLPDEANVFNNFYSTIDRWQDKTRVLFLANSVSITNPYFLEYQINPSQGEQLIRLFDGFMLVHLPDSEAFKSSVMETKFGKFISIAAPEYEKYSVGNQFADNRTELVKPKDPRARHRWNLETRLGWVALWHNRVGGTYYIGRVLPVNSLEYTLIPEHATAERTLLLYTDDVIAGLRSAYRRGMIEFDLPNTHNMFVDVFNKKS